MSKTNKNDATLKLLGDISMFHNLKFWKMTQKGPRTYMYTIHIDTSTYLLNVMKARFIAQRKMSHVL